MVALVLVGCFLMLALLAGFLWRNSVTVYNTLSYMALPPDKLWKDGDYVRNFPNLLKQLYDAGFTTPWPARPTPWCAYRFRRKLHEVLKDAVPDVPRIVQQHLSLWSFVQLHHDELHAVIQVRKIQRARQILQTSLEAKTRQRVVMFLNQCKVELERATQLCAAQPDLADGMHWYPRLRSFEVLLREHGYHISEEFRTLYLWEEADDAVILHEVVAV